ncbi:MAG: cupredoxin domain-containing protein [Chloroflexi bacterium]|nr:cupredoxin domain-containing protein [Chloroflexota bacterium]
MDQHSDAHGAYGGHGAGPRPHPTSWAILGGLTALLLAVALLWWNRDQESNFAMSFLGASIAVTVVAAAGWAVAEASAKRRASDAAATGGGEARYTQVVTFAIADGQLDAARAAGGVLHALDHSDSALRGLRGFQDLRITVSPAAVGPSQALVETTWAAREGLASYEETQRTLLDLVNQHADEVVAGTVQVFDMEVVRDTKEVRLSFGMGAATTIVCGLIVGGFMVGAGLTAFEDDNAAAGGGGAVTPPAGVDTDCSDGTCTLVARDNKFDQTTLTGAAGKAVDLTFENKGKVSHNVHFLTAAGGTDLASGSNGDIIPSGTVQVKFTPPSAGSFYYQCDLHPTEMKGTFTVK